MRVGWCTLVGEFVGVHCLVCVGWCELVGVRWPAGGGVHCLVRAGSGRAGGRAGARAGERAGGRTNGRTGRECKLKTKTPHHDVGKKREVPSIFYYLLKN